MKVALVFGGASAEREVSIKTGKAVLQACKENNFDVDALLIDKNYEEVYPTLKKADIVFNALHGTFGEDGVLQKWLEENNIKFTGSGSFSSALCMNKIECKKILRANGFLTPDWLKAKENIQIEKSFFPCIVKPNAQGSTFGLTFVNEFDDLNGALLKSQRFDKSTLIEKYVKGREITVGILDDNTLPIVEIFPSHKIYDYKCKYTPGMSNYKCPAKIDSLLSKQIMDDSMKIFKLLGCKGYGRLDYILDNNNNYYFLEINTLPGMTATSLLPIAANAQGISFKVLVKKIIDLGLNSV